MTIMALLETNAMRGKLFYILYIVCIYLVVGMLFRFL